MINFNFSRSSLDEFLALSAQWMSVHRTLLLLQITSLTSPAPWLYSVHKFTIRDGSCTGNMRSERTSHGNSNDFLMADGDERIMHRLKVFVEREHNAPPQKLIRKIKEHYVRTAHVNDNGAFDAWFLFNFYYDKLCTYRTIWLSFPVASVKTDASRELKRSVFPLLAFAVVGSRFI